MDRRLLFALGGPIYAGTNEIQRNIIAERLLGLPREKAQMRFDLDEQQRDFAASIDAALAAADLPAAVRAWAEGDTAPGRKVWAQLADLGVTALAVPEKYDGIEAHPVDLVVAAERLGRWCVPGPVTESIAVAPVLLADDDRSAALAAGELIATVALPPQVPRAVDADSAGLILVAADGEVRDGTAGAEHESVDPSRKLFDVTATGDAQAADVARAYEFGVLATAAQLVGAGQALLDASVEYAKQRSQFGRVIGTYQAIKHKLADVHIAIELARPLVYGAALSLADDSADTARDVSAAKVAAADAALLAARSALQTHGAIGFTQEHDLSLWLLRVQALRSAWGDPTVHRRGSWRRSSELKNGNCCARPSRRWSTSTRRLRRCARRWRPNAATTSRCGSCCASRSARPRWWCPRNWAAQAANSPTPPSCSRSWARRWCRRRCWAPRWPSWRCWPPTSPTPTRWKGWPRARSIGAVVFDPGYVVNGDIADVVIAADGKTLSRWTTFTAHPVDTMDLTRRLARVEPQDTADIGADPGLADTAAILLAAEQIGAAAKCLDLTVEYTKDRVQFGRPIGSFQALKHRMADLYVAVQSARAVVERRDRRAVGDVGSAGAGGGQRGVLKVAAEAVQMHGGIAITWEHDIQLYFKRAHGSAQLLGPPREHLRRLESEVF